MMRLSLRLCFAATVCCVLVPAARSRAQQPAEAGTVLQVHVNAVLVPVVVRDASGHAIGDLKQDDFKILDQGKRRQVTGFSMERGDAVAAGAPASEPPAAGSEPAAPAPAAEAPTQRVIVFLFDDRHLSAPDLLQVKKAAEKLLEQPFPDGTRGLVLSFLGINSGLTHNRVPLQAAIEKMQPRQAFQPTANQCPQIDYYEADQILNKDNRTEYGIAMEKAAKCLHIEGASANGDISVGEISKSMPVAQAQTAVQSAAQVALEQGNQDARETLEYMRDVVHTISGLPGQRTLVLISPGFFSLSQETMAMESQVLNLAAGASVTINVLDARGLYGTMMSASESGDESMRSLVIGQSQNNRSDAQRQAKQIMAEMADGSGGTFFHDNNDLAGGLETLVAAPEFKYLLEFSLEDVKLNGAYHALKVEVDRKDVKVQSREGYFAPKASKGR